MNRIPKPADTKVSRFIQSPKSRKTVLGSIDVDNIDSIEHRQAFCAATDNAIDVLELPDEMREQLAAELKLLVRPPSEGSTKRLWIGLGTLLPNKK